MYIFTISSKKLFSYSFFGVLTTILLNYFELIVFIKFFIASIESVIP